MGQADLKTDPSQGLKAGLGRPVEQNPGSPQSPQRISMSAKRIPARPIPVPRALDTASLPA